jgi:hypothetical protein
MRTSAQPVAVVPAGGGKVESAEPPPAPIHRQWVLLVSVLLISVYGGYFGAAMGVLMVAVLGLFLHDTLQRNNALKTSLTVVVNGVAPARRSRAGCRTGRCAGRWWPSAWLPPCTRPSTER